MSVIDYYNTNDSYSATLENAKNALKDQYFTKERIKALINKINQINNLGYNLDIEHMENTIKNSIKINNSNGELNNFEINLSKFLTAVKTENKQLFMDTALELIALKNNMLSGQNMILGQSQFTQENLEKIYQDIMYVEKNTEQKLLDISNRIGRAGEYLAEIHEAKIANDIIAQLVKKDKNNSMQYKINMEGTGQDYGIGQLNIKPVPIQTDNRLIIMADNGSLVAQINFSTKMLSKFSDKSKLNKTANIKFRTSSVNVLIAKCGFDIESEILNGISLHKEKNSNGDPKRLTRSYQLVRQLAGMFLIAQMLEETKQVKGQTIIDTIDYTIVGSRIVPETSIFIKFFNQLNNNKLSAYIADTSVSKILQTRDEQNWMSTDDAEKYFKERAIMLKRSI